MRNPIADPGPIVIEHHESFGKEFGLFRKNLGALR
jgi:hypothetical protein